MVFTVTSALSGAQEGTEEADFADRQPYDCGLNMDFYLWVIKQKDTSFNKVG